MFIQLYKCHDITLLLNSQWNQLFSYWIHVWPEKYPTIQSHKFNNCFDSFIRFVSIIINWFEEKEIKKDEKSMHVIDI